MSTIQSYHKLLRGIAVISLVFAGMLCILIIVNYFQVNRVDPINTEVINQLVDRLNDNPGDDALRVQIRELDLLTRKAYFTNNWQIRTGGYLILIALALFIIAYQLLLSRVKQQVIANPDAPKDVLGIQKNARIGISIVGGMLVISAVLISFFSNQTLGGKLTSAAQSGAIKENPAASDYHQPVDENVTVPDSISFVEQKDPEDEKNLSSDAEEGISTVTIEKADSSTRQKSNPLPEKKYPTNEEMKKYALSFRGYNGTGIVYQNRVPANWNGLTGSNILWKSPVPLQSFNSPIVWENKIFITGANESVREVYCYAKEGGKLLWTTKIEGVPGSPKIAPKTTADTGLGAPTMTTDGVYVYAIFGTGDLVALDMDGKIIWSKNLGVPQNHYGHSSSLIMYREKLIVQYDQKSGGQVMAFKGRTGEILWSTSRKVKISWSSPAIITFKGIPQLILSADPLVAGYNPNTGKELWSVDCIFGEVGPSVCYDNGIVYAVNDYARIAAINLEDPTGMLWEDNEVLSDIPSPVAGNGLLIMPTSYGMIGCYDGKSGELLWDHEFDNNIYSSPVLIGNRIYLMDTKGVMHIFNLSREGYDEVAECPLGEDSMTTPAFSDGKIFIRTQKNLYCIGTK